MADDPWADFRTPAPTTSSPPGARAVDPWADFRVPAAASAQVDKPAAAPRYDDAGDVGGGIVTGLVNGVTGFLGMPGLIQQVDGYLGGKALDALGFPNAAETVRNLPFLPTPDSLNKRVEGVTGPLHQPETTLGQYARTGAEFAVGAIPGPGGVVRKFAETAIPAVASETAGQLTHAKLPEAEPYARLMSAIFGNLGTAAFAARGTGNSRAILNATRGSTPDELRAGQGVLDTGYGIGVPLSGPEGIQQATQNGTRLGSLQRVVESSTGGGPTMARFYANRPGQMRAATGQTLDTIAPQSAQPSTLGPRAAETATGALDEVRQGINAATRPAYDAAGRHVLDPADFDPIARDPAFQASLRRLRNDEVLGPTYAQQPDNSVAVIDAVTKDMRDRGVALGNANNPGFSSQTAGMYGTGAAEARAIARDPARGGIQEYDDALTAQAQARQQNLAPLEQGPLGTVSRVGEGGAGTRSGTQAAAEAVLPSTPLAGGEGEIVDTIRRMAARDPEVTAQLVRQRLADQADTSMTSLVGGEAQGGGAKFAKDIAGTQQKATNLDAVLRALPDSPAAPASMDDLLTILRATGKRMPPGSNTAPDTETRKDLSRLGLLRQAGAAAKSFGGAVLSGARDTAEHVAMGRRNSALADLFTAPDSASRIADIVARGTEPVFANAARRQLLQAPSIAGAFGAGR